MAGDGAFRGKNFVYYSAPLCQVVGQKFEVIVGCFLILLSTVPFQAQELRKFFKSLGAEISEEKSSKGIEDDLHKIIGVCDVCFKDGTQHTLEEIDAVLNSVVSIVVSIPLERGENLILAFCEKMTKAPDTNLARVCLQS